MADNTRTWTIYVDDEGRWGDPGDGDKWEPVRVVEAAAAERLAKAAKRVYDYALLVIPDSDSDEVRPMWDGLGEALSGFVGTGEEKD